MGEHETTATATATRSGGSNTIESLTPLVLLEPELLRPADMAMLLRVSVRQLWRMQCGGKLPRPCELGKSRKAFRWRRREIQRWVDAGMPPRAQWERLRPEDFREPRNG
ncbi:MAG: hypothetical protein JXQ73_25105 [Phycisphaerae bacterium]|nr:hypothetical protein [Phycisphaerae bacterium]